MTRRLALNEALTDAAMSNVILRSSGVGYQHANSADAFESLIAPYFDALDRIWKERSYKIAEYVILGFYPAPLASQELVDATTAWLDGHPDIPAMRRLVIENLAGVERALRAQQRDRSS